MVNDPIADMLTRIRNAIQVNKTSVELPYSKNKEAIAGILKANRFITDFGVDAKGPFKVLAISLRSEDTSSPITTLTRISKPGRRIYTASKDIPTVLSGRGIVIVSTSSGLMTGREARKRGLGGELICKVW